MKTEHLPSPEYDDEDKSAVEIKDCNVSLLVFHRIDRNI